MPDWFVIQVHRKGAESATLRKVPPNVRLWKVRKVPPNVRRVLPQVPPDLFYNGMTRSWTTKAR